MELSSQIDLIGVTGTNGKTTITHLIADLLSKNKKQSAIIGTLGAGSLNKLTPCGLTTPDSNNLQKILHKLAADNIKIVAMEVSSHGLDQKRIKDLEFHTVIFSNLSQDHLDYHLDLEQYFLTKLKLFTEYSSEYKIINTNNEYGLRLAAMLEPESIITYSFSPNAHIQIENAQFLLDKTIFTLNTPWGKETIESTLIGKFNLENLVAAIIACCLQGVRLQDMKQYCTKLLPIPGRMQFFRQADTPTVVVDFAHTADALAKTLEELKRLCQGKLWCVFGCGGNRDRTKRSKMLQAANQYSDRIIITQDNSRDEDPNLIVQDMLSDKVLRPNTTIQLDRELAIQTVIAKAAPRDLILIAGKGHENYQEINGEKLPFSDQEQVQIAFIIKLLNKGHKISIDSRTIEAGDIFLALIGENWNGHEFIAEAIAKGASYLIVEANSFVAEKCSVPVFKVSNTKLTLGKIAKHYRRQFAPKVIAITGSCGKTTTKEMLVSILKENATVLFSKQNFNNEIGVPLTLLKLDDTYKYLVVELGARNLHDIAYLMDIVAPQVGVVTNVGVSHLEQFKTQDNIAITKGEIYTHLHGDDSQAIINIDDPYADFWRTTIIQQKITTFGLTKDANLSAEDITVMFDKVSFTLKTMQGTKLIKLAIPGRHNVMNALAASACAMAVGIALDTIKLGLDKFSSVERRLCIKKGNNGITVIDDCYNASPTSVEAALEVLANYNGEKILVLGEMRELGSVAEQAHRDVGTKAKNLGINRVMTTGTLTKLTVQNFGTYGEYFTDKTALIAKLLTRVTPNSVVLIKGSFSTHMEEVTTALMQA